VSYSVIFEGSDVPTCQVTFWSIGAAWLHLRNRSSDVHKRLVFRVMLYSYDNMLLLWSPSVTLVICVKMVERRIFTCC